VSATAPGAISPVHVPKASASLLLQIAGAITAVGAVLCIAAALSDPTRFAFAYLTGFIFVTTLGLGGLFFVMLQHVTQAGWSVGPRRQMEWLSGILPIVAILFIPIALFHQTIFHAWISPDKTAIGYDMLEKKGSYLNVPFFFARAVTYFVVWAALSWIFRTKSLEQDRTGDVGLTMQMQRASPVSMYLFAFSITFAAFDWLMSLMPTWYSTIFGVYVFSGSATSSLACLALMTIALQRAGLGSPLSTVEHRHDIGKLLFGFIVFWAYIAFDQFFLIWYANIPEETIFYKMRWGNSWEMVSYLILFGHFWVPFLLLLSRHVKRNFFGLGLGAAIVLFMHYVDMYWLVMPNLDKELHLTWIDLAGMLGPVGILCSWLAYRASRDAVYPLNDPRTPEAVALVNL
jgi:hypothetical protein